MTTHKAKINHKWGVFSRWFQVDCSCGYKSAWFNARLRAVSARLRHLEEQ